MFKMKDIEKRFTEITAEYIADGCTFSCQTMKGHQGEEGKVDLTDGEYIYRILLYSELSHSFYDKDTDKMILEVRLYKLTEEIKRGFTVWNNDGTCIRQEVFFKMSERGRDHVYTTDKQEAIACQELRYKRWKAQGVRYNNWCNSFSGERVLHFVRRHKGYGRVKADQIWVRRYRGDGERVRFTIHVDGKKEIFIG